MDLSIDALKDMGAFTGAPVEKEIVLQKDGKKEKTATVYVRKLSYYSAVSDIKSLNAKSDAVAGRIASAICDKEGRPIFKSEDITGLYADGSPVLLLGNDGKPVQSRDSDGNLIFDENEDPVFEQRGALNSEITMELLRVIGEVNGKKTKS